MNINHEIRRLFYKHFPTPAVGQQVDDANMKAFIEELGTVVQALIAKTTSQEIKSSALMPTRELEEILVMVRLLREMYEDPKHEHTPEEFFRLDELKQLEYRLTEKILTNR